MSSRPARYTERIPGEPGLHIETLSPRGWEGRKGNVGKTFQINSVTEKNEEGDFYTIKSAFPFEKVSRNLNHRGSGHQEIKQS